ncbi:eukaryotic translation initiation factor 3 subunit H-like [Artemia franciscana]|uniref:Eukaryotic translation initiation factor 3 subunit H n=1 Tax=Artemia franciscana TaxID=6661 RepID=A0AA88I316_ARTSF|nr:hypothetical protein QYM36_003286 [Artemia franciscana]
MAARKKQEYESFNETVQVDGLVVMKIIKHCQDEGAGAIDLAQGVLLGLASDKKLEVTNSFPFPKNLDDPSDEEQYQMDTMRLLRKVNVDHLQVGWYQSTQQGQFLTPAFLDSQYTYQTTIEDSIVLVYDPLKTSRGFLYLKAYRLTPLAVSLFKEGDLTYEGFKNTKLAFDLLYTEMKVVIHNSHLMNALLCEIDERRGPLEVPQVLDLGVSSMLEKHMRNLMDNLDEIIVEVGKFNNYQRQVQKQQLEKLKYIQKRSVENTLRQAKGEPPLPEDDIHRLFKPLPAPSRIESASFAAQSSDTCRQILSFCAQSIGKMYVAESVQENLKQ